VNKCAVTRFGPLRVRSDEWATKGEDGKLYVRAFDRAEIDLVTAKIVAYDGVKH